MKTKMIKKIIKTYVDGYLDIWRSLFDIKKTTTKSNFIRFVWFNFLCILIVAVKISNFIRDEGGLIYTISFLFFLVTFIFALLKVDVSALSIRTLFKIIFIAILVAIANCYTEYVNSYHLGFGGLILLCVYFVLVIIFVPIAILFFNTLRRTPITNLSLIVYFFILLIVTNMLTIKALINL
jgi:hypothetical protein